MTDPRIAQLNALGVELREALGDALHSAYHPGHSWSGCNDPDGVYDRWMVRFLATLDGWTLIPSDTSLAYDTGFQDGLGSQAERLADLREALTIMRRAAKERFAEIDRLCAALDAHHRGLALMGDGADKCALCRAVLAIVEEGRP